MGESKAVVEALEGDLPEAMGALARAGLADAFVMLRRVEELSEGQRYRLEVARAMLQAQEAARRGKLAIVLADEFLAKLDRTTAKVVARLVGKWVRGKENPGLPHRAIDARDGGVCWVAASSHDDLLEALEPDVLVMVGLGGEMQVVSR